MLPEMTTQHPNQLTLPRMASLRWLSWILLGVFTTPIVFSQDSQTETTSNNTSTETTTDKTEDSDDDDAVESPLAPVIDSKQVTKFNYRLTIKGKMLTPATDGNKEWSLNSSATFDFLQRQFPVEASGPLSLAANRKFSSGNTTTLIGDDHRTTVRLEPAHYTVRTTGQDTGLQHVSVSSTLSRPQLDLLQMSCDPLACTGLLPSRDVVAGDKWNTDSWVLPMLTGLEAVVEQQTTCELKSLNDKSAEIAFECKAEGAVYGSSSTVVLKGKLTLDREAGFITDFEATQTEKRSAGPVSPGLDVTANIVWKQSPETSNTAVPDDAPPEKEQVEKLTLQLVTPWRLRMQHGREWHLFHQTSTLMMLRLVQNGSLIAQCNISRSVSVPPGEHTPDEQFTSDVQSIVKDRGGSVIKEGTVRDDDKWRIRHVIATTKAGEDTIQSDYFLCAAASGEQYSLVFSHSSKDSESFTNEIRRMIDGLSLSNRRPAIPFQ